MDYIVVDVREPYEYQSGHVKGSLNIPLSHLMNGPPQLRDVAKDTSIIVYCRTGNRSSIAQHALNVQGYTNVIDGINQEQVRSKFGIS